MTETTHLALPFIDAAQAQKHVTHNEALQLLDAVVQVSALARDQSAPPASPAEGARYLVGAGATGAFAGKDLQIATWLAGGWTFLAPKSGWLVYVAAEQISLVYDGAAWLDAGLTLRALQGLALLGIGTSADAGNPLAAKLNAALFAAKTVAEGGAGDLRFKLEKEAAGNTVSQLYQTNWSGRAETGLIGDDNFHVKVSPDGSAWKEAIDIDRSTGLVSFPSGIGDGSLAGFRNRLRNASFAINQRAVAGTVTLAADAYGHDGVKAGASGATYGFSTSGLDTTLTITAGSLVLPIEGALIEGGGYVLSQAGTAPARIWQTSPSGSYATVPASGMAATGLAANTLTAVEFSTGSVLRPQLEPGAYPTSFERRPPGVELALCQRYYQISSGLAGGWGNVATNATYAVTFPVAMRTTPTASLVNGSVNGGSAVEFSIAQRVVSAIAAASLNKYGGRFDLTTAAASAAQRPSVLEAGTLAFSAEI